MDRNERFGMADRVIAIGFWVNANNATYGASVWGVGWQQYNYAW